MELSGKLTFNRIAVKFANIEKKTKSGLILPDNGEADKISIDSFEDHPIQGIVVGVGDNVTVCKKGDIILLRIGVDPLPLNDKGTTFFIYYEADVLLVREE